MLHFVSLPRLQSEAGHKDRKTIETLAKAACCVESDPDIILSLNHHDHYSFVTTVR